MKVIFKNTSLVFQQSRRMVELTPTSENSGYVAKSGSQGWTLAHDNASITTNLYNLASLGISEGDTIHIEVAGLCTESNGVLITFNDIIDITEVVSNMSKSIDHINTGTPISGTSYSTVDVDYIIPVGAKMIALAGANTSASYPRKLSKYV